MRRRDDPHVDLDRLGAADRRERALLQHAQQLDLQRGGHVADLVEEERAAVGDLEQPRLILHRAGERAAHVAEQRALEQVVVERRAVLDDERLLRARPVIVDRARDQLLAGAALAVDEHGRLALDDLVEQLDDVAHRGRVADNLGERMRERRRRDRRRAARARPRRRPRATRSRTRARSRVGRARARARRARPPRAAPVRRRDRVLDIAERAPLRPPGRVHDAGDAARAAHRRTRRSSSRAWQRCDDGAALACAPRAPRDLAQRGRRTRRPACARSVAHVACDVRS